MNTPSHRSVYAPCKHLATKYPAPVKGDDTPTKEEHGFAPQLAKPSLLVIEDHESLLDGLIPQLGQEYEVTVVRSMAELQLQLAQKRFTLATVDLTFDRQLVGLDMMPLLNQAGIRFLVFSGTAQEWHICAAIRLGASGYVSKEEKVFYLLDALTIIAAGDFIFPDEFLENLEERKDQQFPELGDAETAAINVIFRTLTPTNLRMPANSTIAKERKVGVRRIENIIRDLVLKFRLRDTKRDALLAELMARGYYPGANKDSFQKLGIFDPMRRKSIKKRR